MKYYTGLILTIPTTAKAEEYSYDIVGADTTMDKPYPINNQKFIQHGRTFIAKEIEIPKYVTSLTYTIKYKGKVVASVDVNPYTTSGKLSRATSTTDKAGKVKIFHTKVSVNTTDKKKFIVICAGRGLGKYNQGANFLNTAKHHITEIQANKYPNLPKFDPKTCEIVSHEDLFYRSGYYTFTEYAEIDGKDDGLQGKLVPVGELHRWVDIAKIFDIYSNIQYVAYFGHSSVHSKTKKGRLLIGDRSNQGTNGESDDFPKLSIKNVLTTAQFRFFGCKSALTKTQTDTYKPVAELFAEHFKGRECYGWASNGGSIFTHDMNYGHTGFNKTGVSANSPTIKIDSGKNPTWLVSFGTPEGWFKFKK